MASNQIQVEINSICTQAKNAFYTIANLNSQDKNNLLKKIASSLQQKKSNIIQANALDVKQAKTNRLKTSLIDRLTLTEERIDNLVSSVADIIALPDPVGEIVYSKRLPNGLSLHQVRVPIGVIFCIFESRPNVVIDIACLCIKSGNVAILKGGKEAEHTNAILGDVIQSALQEILNDKAQGVVQMVADPTRTKTNALLTRNDAIDIVVPRGGEALIQYVSETSNIPVIKHDKGLCHVFIDASAIKTMAINIANNSKVQRPGVCNAMETLLIHKDFPHTNELVHSLLNNGVIVLGDETIQQVGDKVKPATKDDWHTEYLDMRLSIKTIDSLEEAISWINLYGSHHTDAIVTESYEHVNLFLERVDSACVFVNTSTRFSDGSCFGLGAEVGISTQKLHVRGPMGVRDLTCLKYKLYGNGQIRT